jgi:translation initiation factor 1 (eIF-1/SUI1)
MSLYNNEYGLLDLSYITIEIYVTVEHYNLFTVVKNLPLGFDGLNHTLKILEEKFNTYGSFKNNEMLFLGDHVEECKNYFISLGLEVIVSS